MVRATHAVVKMSDAQCATWGITPIGFPVRKRMLSRIMLDGDVDLEVLLDETDRFLTEHPDLRWLHQDNMSLLAYYGAKAAAEAGAYEQVVHFAEVGLRHRPGHHGHHAHLGLAKHCLGDLEGAVEAYRYILDDVRADADVLVRGYCAQALLELDRAFEGLLLCWPTPIGLEFDDTWFSLIRRLCDACEVPYPSRPSKVAEGRRLRDVLAEVPGLGAARQDALIERYRTVRALAAATHGSIAATPGLSDVLAVRVYARLHPERIVNRSPQ